MVSLAQVRWRRASSVLRNRLGDFAEEVIFLKEAALAQECFFGQLQDEIDYLDPELLAERCFEWFIFDYPLSSGQTVIELFRDLFVSRLTLDQALLLVLWEEARSSFYRVQTIFPGKGLVLQDVLNGKTYPVREPGVRIDVDPGTILYVRLLRVGAEYEFSTSAIGIPVEAYANLISWLKSDYRHCAEHMPFQGKVGWNDYLRFRAPTINRKFVRLGLGYQDMPMSNPDRVVIPRLLSDILNGPFGGGAFGEDDQTGAELDVLLHHLRGTGVVEEPVAGKTGVNRADEYAVVAREVACGLAEIGSTPEEVNQALRLWWDFCVLEEPAVRKPGVWAATVIYTVIRLQGENRISQGDLARRFGVASSSISSSYGRLARVLALKRGI